jgi:hypothetical protein
MVQIKSTAFALVAASVIAPAVASYYYPEDSLVTREDFDEYDDLLARDYDFDLEEREFDNEELAFREFLERDFDENELVERDPFFRGMWNKIRHPHGQAQQQQYDPSVDASAREFDDEMELEAREPEADYEELMQRYFDDLYERQLAAEAEAELAARDFEDEELELVQRAPSPNIGDFFNKLFHIKPKQAEKKKDDSASDSDVDAREFEEFDELD